jgi:hypothetical protein
MKVRIAITGTRPLLMHNVQLASPLNSYAKALKALTSKKTKTDDDRVEMARIEFEGGLYIDETGPFVPSSWVFRSLINGARITRAGKKIERGVVMADLQMPLLYKGPRDIAGLWADGDSEFVDMRSVVVSMKKIDRTRPIFRNWAIEAECFIDESVIDFDEFASVARAAGEMEGLGDYRLMYGRYSVVVTEI